MAELNGPAIAFVADGKLYTQAAGCSAKIHDSAFIQTLLDRAERSRERNDWKTGGMSWNIGSRAMNPFGMSGEVPAEVRRVRYSGVAANADKLFYAIETDSVSGLFKYTPAEQYEQRIYHRISSTPRTYVVGPMGRWRSRSDR